MIAKVRGLLRSFLLSGGRTSAPNSRTAVPPSNSLPLQAVREHLEEIADPEEVRYGVARCPKCGLKASVFVAPGMLCRMCQGGDAA